MNELKKVLADFKKEVKRSEVRKSIVSIALFGSAAKGEWVKGVSDIDMIIITKSKEAKRDVSKFIEKAFMKLSKKYSLKLGPTLGKKRYSNLLLNLIFKIESYLAYSTTILSLDEFDIVKYKISEPRIWFITTFISPACAFLYKLKEYGKTIYGKNLIKQIKIKVGFFDKLKITLLPYHLNAIAAITFLMDPKFALKNSIKATLYVLEDELFLLRAHLGPYRKEAKAYEHLFKHSKANITHLRTALDYRQAFQALKLSKREAFKFMCATFRFILSSQLQFRK